MKRLFLSLFLTIFSIGAALASPYRISLLTCGPGDELYSTFGHSAMRVVNAETGSDTVYNFGMFNFADPNFYVKFVRGDLDYYLALQRFDYFLMEYVSEDRYVYEQVLDLTDEQAEAVVNELNCRYLPENRTYKYKFIQRNCTTELRDIIVDFSDPEESFLLREDIETWRYYLNACVQDKLWARIGINIVLGSKVDRKINNFEKMWLPELLYDGLPDITRIGDDGESKGIVAQTVVLNSNDRSHGGGWLKNNYHYLLFGFVALLLVFLNSRIADSIYFFLLGVLGLLVIFLMFYSTHMEFQANYNLLWCNPLWILSGIFILRKKPKATFVLSGLSLLCSLATLVIWLAGIQGFDPVFLIMVFSLFGISLKYFRGYRTYLKKESWK